jgi:sarcosine oxidase
VRTPDVEFAVVGAGLLGLCAARALARRGREVVVCERYAVGHGGGGSHGTARIFRLGYDDPVYVRLALMAQGSWRELEEETATTLVTTTGQVTFGDGLDVLIDAMAQAGAPHEPMSARHVAERFPVLAVPTPAVFEPASGVIAADACLAALRGYPGVELLEGRGVERCVDDGRRVRLTFSGADGAGAAGRTDELRASVAVVCAGPATASVLTGAPVDLRLWPTLEQVAYLTPSAGTVAEVPVFVERRHPWFYGLPVLADGLVKVSLHGAGPIVALDVLDPSLAAGPPDAGLVAELTASARALLPGLDPEPVATERCVYDNAPDGDFVLDRVGRLVIGAGTSGHGFKFGPLLGEMLADLATGAGPDARLGSLVERGRFAAARR